LVHTTAEFSNNPRAANASRVCLKVCTRKRTVREVEKLFQVSAGFL
jgi:hypothetical protein